MHSNILATGIPEAMGLNNANYAPSFIYAAIREVIGDEGTLVVPTFTYSFCHGEIFDPHATPSRVGAFGNWLMRQPGAHRSCDPNFSFCAIGPLANELLDNISNNSFDLDNSVFARLYKKNAHILGWGASSFTIGHYIEKRLHSQHRYNKIFTGYIKKNSRLEKESWLYTVRVNIDNARADDPAFTELIIKNGVAKAAPLGKSRLICARAQDLGAYLKHMRRFNPWFLLHGPPVDLIDADKRRTGEENFSIDLRSANLDEMAQKLTPLPRNIVSDGYDAALKAMDKVMPMHIHEYVSGMEALTWIVPERWICRSASLKRLDGSLIFSAEESQFHVLSYSLPKKGKVSKDELFQHLYTHWSDPDSIPFMFKYYERDWGLCATQKQKDSLKDDYYFVNIDTDFSYSSLKVGEVIVQGSSDDSFVFCAHLCHPGQLSDGLSGVLAGIKLFEWIKRLPKPHYTYRLLILPETIGSAAWLSQNREIWPQLKGGLFLEMLSTQIPYHTLMHSNQPDSYSDRVIASIIKTFDPASQFVPFIEAPMNDERMFNGVGIECPMSSLMRILPKNDPLWPFPEYHTNKDDLEHANLENLANSIECLKEIVHALENDAIPKPLFNGEIMVSRYNSLDYATMGMILRRICFAMDGKRSIAEIASLLNQPFRKVKAVLDAMKKEKLITYSSVRIN